MWRLVEQRAAIAIVIAAVAACTHPSANMPLVPTTNVQPGACGVPGRDGVVSTQPQLERADRDLDGDGRAEIIVVDRAKCDALGNCYWNVFEPGRSGECARYLGNFAGAALEPLATRGDANMVDVRAYWKQNGGRMLLEPYRFVRGGYLIDDSDVLQCKRAADDRLECADTRR